MIARAVPRSAGVPPRILLALALAASLAVAFPAATVRAAECADESRAVIGLRFVGACADVADVLVDPAIDADDVAVIRRQVGDDVAAVQAEFAMSFDVRPTLYVFAATSRYAAGLHAVFGYPEATARWVAENSVSFFEPSLRLVAVNWEAIRERRPIAAIRHELTHLLTLRACSPRCDLVPAWLNEGQARLAEAMVPGSAWRMLRVRYEATSLAATRTLLPLTALVTQQSWNAITSWDGYYKYQEAARVVDLLRADIGDAPIARLYERIRGGEDVARAYAGLTGKSFADFVDALPERILDGTDGPGIATARGTPEGTGASYVLYGFGPDAELSVSVAGAYFSSTQSIRVSPRGTWFGWLGDALPRGTYTITAASGSTCVTVSVAKPGPRPIFDPDASADGYRRARCGAAARGSRPS